MLHPASVFPFMHRPWTKLWHPGSLVISKPRRVPLSTPYGLLLLHRNFGLDLCRYSLCLHPPALILNCGIVLLMALFSTASSTYHRRNPLHYSIFTTTGWAKLLIDRHRRSPLCRALGPTVSPASWDDIHGEVSEGVVESFPLCLTTTLWRATCTRKRLPYNVEI